MLLWANFLCPLLMMIYFNLNLRMGNGENLKEACFLLIFFIVFNSDGKILT